MRTPDSIFNYIESDTVFLTEEEIIKTDRFTNLFFEILIIKDPIKIHFLYFFAKFFTIGAEDKKLIDDFSKIIINAWKNK